MLIRPAALPDDLADIEALLTRVEAADGHAPIGEHKYLMLFQGEPGRVVGLIGEEQGKVMAYVALTPGARRGWWGMEVAVDPHHRAAATFAALFEAGSSEAARQGGAGLRAWLFQPRLAEVALRAGFQAERELLKLERQLPGGFADARRGAAMPDGVTLAPFVPDRDEQAWLDVNNAAFTDHPENGQWTVEILKHRMSQPWFRVEDMLMA